MDNAPPEQGPFSIATRLKALGHAIAGLGFMFRSQHNTWIHVAAGVVAVAASVVLRISLADWRWIIAAIGLVWAAEAFNTAIECICDLVSPGYNLLVKRAKDVGAAAVLIASAGAAFIGVITFWPYLHLRA